MDPEFLNTADWNWIAPFSFRSPRPRLPNNINDTRRRAHILQKSVLKDRDTFKEIILLHSWNVLWIMDMPKLRHLLFVTKSVGSLPLFGVYYLHESCFWLIGQTVWIIHRNSWNVFNWKVYSILFSSNKILIGKGWSILKVGSFYRGNRVIHLKYLSFFLCFY